jgi:hypothetical protein
MVKLIRLIRSGTRKKQVGIFEVSIRTVYTPYHLKCQ